MESNSVKLQSQYNKIYSYFKSTTEPFDSLEWDGRILNVIFEDTVIEKYIINNLKTIIGDLETV
jgi:hypothetical protein